MKEQFDNESRQALVNYRYQRSVDTMREAEVTTHELIDQAAVFIATMGKLL